MYKITIVDCETGEVSMSENADCIIAAVNTEKSTQAISLVCTNGKNLITTYAAMKKNMEMLKRRHAIVGMLDETGIIDAAIKSLESDGMKKESLAERAIREALNKHGKKD